MESIIARQKVGKRRRAPKNRDSIGAFLYRPQSLRIEGRARPYSPTIKDRPQRILGPRLEFSLGTKRILASLRLKLSRLPKTRLAMLAGSFLAAIVAVSAGLAAIAAGPSFPLPSQGLLPAENSASTLLLDYVSPELAGKADADLDSTDLPPAPVTLEYSTYTARSGDSLASIAKRFGLYMDTIISANGISSASRLKSGAQLRIPNINGLIYKVRQGDNLASIAKKYKIDTTRIVDANDLGSSRIVAGMSLFIPGARLPDADLKKALGQKVQWPVRGALSSFFGYRADPFTGVRRFHAGIDIVVNSGTTVRAAMDGRVSDSGYNANYGNYIIVNHADGFQTLYGHLTSAMVRTGAAVAQGSTIGVSGNTGYSTGAHLHFGLFKQGIPLNPQKYLK